MSIPTVAEAAAAQSPGHQRVSGRRYREMQSCSRVGRPFVRSRVGLHAAAAPRHQIRILIRFR